ncbi:hypothetical protein F4861DRAFT_267158 [Xylaria intraflava]|nr:hypothetical protein F4861DRAFT_267158 [Xylaria intraflava]
MKRFTSRLAPLASSSAHKSVPSQIVPADLQRLLASLSDAPPENIQPGEHVISVCKKHNIFFSQHLKPLRGLKQKQPPFDVLVNVSQNHCVQRRSMRYFDKLEHPFATSLLDVYIEKKKEPLWMYCSATGESAYPNKIASKKIAHAMRDALADAGYDRFGRRVLVGGETSAVAELYGSIDLMSLNPLAVCNAPFTDVLRFAKKILSSIQPTLQRDRHGRPLGQGTIPGAQQAQRHEHSSWREQQGNSRSHR